MPTMREKIRAFGQAPTAVMETGKDLGKLLLVIAIATVVTAFLALAALVKGM